MSQHPCFHCGEPLPPGAPIYATLGDARQPMCCIGCKAVAEFIHTNGLDKFYEHRTVPLAEYDLKAESRDWMQYDQADLRNRYVHVDGSVAETILDIGGMYCSACVWLLERALKSEPAVRDISVNPATKRAVVRWNDAALPFSGLLAAIARVGFKPRPRAAGIDAEQNSGEQRTALRRLIVAAAAGMQVMMFAVALYAGAHYGIEGQIEEFLRLISLLVCLPIVFYSARPFFTGAIRGLRARSPGMDLPVSLAIGLAFIASAYATFTGSGEIYFDSVAMFVLFLSGTRYIEMRTRHQADDVTQALANMLPETVTRLTDGKAEVIALDRLSVGDIVLLRPGDVVPADGDIESGSIDVDESLLTGESVPVHREAGGSVCAGSINRSGNASIRITLTGADTSLAETARLLERARADRPPAALLADRIAGRFVLGMLAVTALTGTIWLQLDPARAFEVVLATLVVTCPCALALATPAALAATTSRLAGTGFLLVRSRVLDVLAKPATVVFDKTGTLTAGRPQIEHIEQIADDLSAEESVRIAAAIEAGSEHVLARAFADVNDDVDRQVTDMQVVPGQGVEAVVDGKRYRLGRHDYVTELILREGVRSVAPQPGRSLSCAWLATEEDLLARFDIGDELRPDATTAIESLRGLGYKLVVASGDRQDNVADVAAKLGVDDWHGELTPEGKLELVAVLRTRGQPVVMVGDGINDAPVLAAADASIAVDAGTALARASADAVVPGKRLATIVDAARRAIDTRRIIRQNILWAIGYNLTAVPLAATGMLAPWMAAIGMSLSSLLVVGNATRLRQAARIDTSGENAAARRASQEATT